MVLASLENRLDVAFSPAAPLLMSLGSRVRMDFFFYVRSLVDLFA